MPAGYVGVVYNMNGGVDGEVLTQGWHLVAPTKKVTTYSIGIEQSYLTADSKGDSDKDESFNVPTSDGKTVRVNLEFSYRFDEARVAQTFVTFKGKSGEEIKDTFIKPKIIAWTQEVSANYPVTDIFGDQRTAINACKSERLGGVPLPPVRARIICVVAEYVDASGSGVRTARSVRTQTAEDALQGENPCPHI